MRLKPILRKLRQSFQIRVFLALVLVILLFIPGTGLVSYLQALRVTENQMQQYTISTSEQITRRVSAFLSHHRRNVELLAGLISQGFIETEHNSKLIDALQLFKEDHPEFVNIYFGNNQGQFTMVPPQRPEVHTVFDPRLRPWYKGALTKGKTSWTGVYLFASTRKPGITVSAPVRNTAGQIVGICGIDIDLVAFSEFLHKINLSRQGVAYIFENSTGHIIAYPGLIEVTDQDRSLQLLTQCRQDLGKRAKDSGLTTYDGEKYFTAYTSFPDKNWTVGVTLPVSGYLSQIQVIRKSTIGLVIVGLLLSSLFSYLLTRTIIGPLLQLRQGIERISRGDLEHRVTITDPDIAQSLAKSFNRMALSLQNSLEELKSTYAELQEKQKLAAVGKMTAGIAHELKNPLGIILGSTQVVLDRNRPMEMREKAATFIMDEVVRLDNTLKSFLSFARPSTPVFSEVDIIRLLEETLSATKERYAQEGYQIICDFPGTVPLFEGDPMQIRQVILNILLNAFQAMPEGGRVTIRVRAKVEPKRLKANKRFISTRNPFTVARQWIILSITDEGHGIPDEQMGRILEPFISFRDDGIGLGLSIVSQLVKLHRGHIQIDSKSGQGTSFHLFFPCILNP